MERAGASDMARVATSERGCASEFQGDQ